jgi:penicillin amidase
MRWVGRVIIVLILVVVMLGGGGYIYLRQSLPQMSGSVTLPGLRQSVEIVRDRDAVPHIFAKSILDADFALGYVHAQDRLWQMEFNRRIAAGRLSEILGPRTLATDKFLRALGVHQAAEAALQHFDPSSRDQLAAYADGVNAFIATHSGPLPPEFLLLGVTPEPWTPADSVGWIKMMAWDLGRNWSDELFRLRLASRLTPKQIEEFLPPYPGDAPVALGDLAPLYRQLGIDVKQLAAIALPPAPDGAGSNNWVVAGSRTATGKPLLANDPHLGLTAPAIWYFVHLDAPDLHAIGASLPGVPMIVLGRNARIAWGFTNTGSDVEDLYIEKLDPANPANYIAPGGAEPFSSRTEVIKVKGEADVPFTVRGTRHGPVISDALATAAKAVGKDYVLSFAWTALAEDDRTVQAGLHLAQAENWPLFVDALRDFTTPQQNVVYADVDGNIGFIAPGKIPIRKPDNDIKGLAPSPGWEAKYDWDGYIPFDRLPMAFNPPAGKVVTANNKIVADDYPFYLTSEWAEPYRARRIEQLLAEREIHSVESFAAMQADTKSLMATDLLPLLLKAKLSSADAAKAVELLRGWDGRMLANRSEPLIFAAWVRELNRLIYADKLGDLFEDAWKERPIFLRNVLTDKDGQSHWCNDIAKSRRQGCDEVIAQALDLALADLSQRYGSDTSHWRWGAAHIARSAHRPFNNVPVLRDLFDVTVPTPGDTYTIDVGMHVIADERAPFESRHAPSLRAIYDLADLERSVFMHSTGQSGNPLSPYYANFASRWENVQYIPMTTRRADIEVGSLGTLTLRPKDSRP